MSSSASPISAAERARTMMKRTVPGNGFPKSLLWAVLTGMKALSSWSLPSRLWPLASTSPTTWKGWFLIRIVRPTGSSPPKRLRATVCPSRTTRAARRWSTAVKDCPDSRPQSRTSRYSGVVP